MRSFSMNNWARLLRCMPRIWSTVITLLMLTLKVKHQMTGQKEWELKPLWERTLLLIPTSPMPIIGWQGRQSITKICWDHSGLRLVWDLLSTRLGCLKLCSCSPREIMMMSLWRKIKSSLSNPNSVKEWWELTPISSKRIKGCHRLCQSGRRSTHQARALSPISKTMVFMVFPSEIWMYRSLQSQCKQSKRRKSSQTTKKQSLAHV